MFLRKLFKRKKAPPTPPPVEIQELSLPKLEVEVKKAREKKLEEIENEARRRIGELPELIGSVERLAQALEQAEPSEEVHVRLLRASTEAKRLLAEKVRRAVRSLKVPKTAEWESLVSFSRDLGRVLGLVTSAFATHGGRASVVFKPQVQELWQWVQRFQALASELRGLVEARGEEIFSLDGIFSKLLRLKELRDEVGSASERKSSLENELKSLRFELGLRNQELKDLLASEEAKRDEELRRELEALELKVRNLRGEASRIISGLSRPLKKLRKLVVKGERGLEREKLKTLELCLESPADALFTCSSRVEELLEELENCLKAGELELSQREQKKKLELVKKALEGRLQELKQEYNKALNEISERKKALIASAFGQRKAKLESLIQELQKKIKRAEAELEAVSKNLEKLKDEISKAEDEIQEKASALLGKPVKIKF